ncbi:MAG TPA: iron-containing alcohol dehydrogenase, partial [Mycobacterium sp.]|nr:iron-containing alcohol dehydrogenase [Mycobacterium sp.]
MITVPDPAALLESLRADGQPGVPNIDVRIGASVLDSAIADSIARFIGRDPIILSDGGPYRTAAGAVVDRLAGHLGCRVVQLGRGTVRADEETVEQAVAEVGEHRLLVSVGSGTLTDIAKVTAQRTGNHHVAIQT